MNGTTAGEHTHTPPNCHNVLHVFVKLRRTHAPARVLDHVRRPVTTATAAAAAAGETSGERRSGERG